MRQTFAKPKWSQASYWISLSGQSTELEEAETKARWQLEQSRVIKSRRSDDGHAHKPLTIAKRRLLSDFFSADVYPLDLKSEGLTYLHHTTFVHL